MDTKLIKTFGEDILQYRLRTARQKKRMQYKDFDKQLIQLDKKRAALWERKCNLGWEPLLPPVQKGWKRSFVLRDDVARSKSAAFYQAILDKINTNDWSYRKDFLVKRRKFGRKRYVVKEQRLLEPREYHFLKLDFTESEQRLFYPEYRTENWSKTPVKYYVFAEPWRFVLKVKPNMIEKIRIKDAILESDITKLDNYIKTNSLEKRIGKIKRGYHQYKWSRQDRGGKYHEPDPHKNKSLIQLLDMIKET
jgi:hypothetical protein